MDPLKALAIFKEVLAILPTVGPAIGQSVKVVGMIREALDENPSNDPTWAEVDAMVSAAQAGALRDTSRDV